MRRVQGEGQALRQEVRGKGGECGVEIGGDGDSVGFCVDDGRGDRGRLGGRRPVDGRGEPAAALVESDGQGRDGLGRQADGW